MVHNGSEIHKHKVWEMDLGYESNQSTITSALYYIPYRKVSKHIFQLFYFSSLR